MYNKPAMSRAFLGDISMNGISRPRSVSLVAAAVACAIANGAWAQTTLGEIVVTARKRTELIQDVPFAISARTEEALRNAGAVNIEDVARNVAGFNLDRLGRPDRNLADILVGSESPWATTR